MTAPPKNKIRVKLITVHQAEGLTQDCTTTMHETWADAEKRIRSICEKSTGMGCLKTDFTLVYHGGETYSGRYSAAPPMHSSYDGTLADHVRSHLTFSAGLRRPDHIPEDRYEAYLAECETRMPGFKQQALDFLKSYALTDEEAGPSLSPVPNVTTPPNPEPRNDTVNTTATAAPQKSASEAHAENVAYAKANNLPMVPITGNTYPIKGLLYVMGGKWDSKTKTWSVPSHKAAEAQAAADKFARPVKTTSAPTAAPVTTVATPQNLAVANLNAMTPRPAPVAAPKPVKGKTKGAPMSPLQKRLNALLTGAKAIHDSVPPGDAIRPQLAFTINHIQVALDRLG